MMLYWGMFTVGFLFGAILAYAVLAPKKPEDDPEYETPPNTIIHLINSRSNLEKTYALFLKKQQQETSPNLINPQALKPLSPRSPLSPHLSQSAPSN